MERVASILRQFGRWQRYGVMPNDGGLDDQDEITLHAFDIISTSLRMPRVHDRED